MGQFPTIFLIIPPSQVLSSARPFSYCAPKVSTIFLFLKTFVLMLCINSSNFHVRPRILKLETAAESAGAGAAHETKIDWQGYFLKDQWKDQVVRNSGQKTWKSPEIRTASVQGLKLPSILFFFKKGERIKILPFFLPAQIKTSN